MLYGNQKYENISAVIGAILTDELHLKIGFNNISEEDSIKIAERIYEVCSNQNSFQFFHEIALELFLRINGDILDVVSRNKVIEVEDINGIVRSYKDGYIAFVCKDKIFDPNHGYGFVDAGEYCKMLQRLNGTYKLGTGTIETEWQLFKGLKRTLGLWQATRLEFGF